MGEPRLKIKCPVHGVYLSQSEHAHIRAWFCPECERYYTDNRALAADKHSTMDGKPVVLLAGNTIEAIKKKLSGLAAPTYINPNYTPKPPKEAQKKKKAHKKKSAQAQPNPPAEPKPPQNSSGPPFTLPSQIDPVPQSAILKTQLFQWSDLIGECVIVEKPEEQSTRNGIFWVCRRLAIEILSAVMQGETAISYHGADYALRNTVRYPGYAAFTHSFKQFTSTDVPKTVYLFKNKNLPSYQTDRYQTVTAVILCAKTKTPVPITVYYDADYDMYFLNEETYRLYRERYGLPLIRIGALDTRQTGEGFSAFNDHSELNLYGYSVGRVNGMTDAERRRLLSQLIDNKIMPKSAIINHLEWLLSTRSGDLRMEDACAAWRADLRFCLDYKINAQRSVLAGKIKPIR